jgi:hypothetical protein
VKLSAPLCSRFLAAMVVSVRIPVRRSLYGEERLAIDLIVAGVLFKSLGLGITAVVLNPGKKARRIYLAHSQIIVSSCSRAISSDVFLI